VEQSEPIQPAEQKHSPSLQIPCPEQFDGQIFSEQSAPVKLT